ncbi:MAG: hypothetical protein AAGJ52_05785 [Pseudomonadota bacterium]
MFSSSLWIIMQARSLHHSHSLEGIPNDPRARRVLGQLGGPRSFRERWLGADRRLSNTELNRLYWLVRWIGPRLIHLEGVPGPRSSLMLAAAAADAGCRKIRCPLLMSVHDDSARDAWSVLQQAGLDWLLSSSERSSNARELLVLASSIDEQLERLAGLMMEPRAFQSVLGLVDRKTISRADAHRLEGQLDRLGLHPVLPLSSGPAFWLAVPAPLANDSRFD